MAAVPHKECGVCILLEPDGSGLLFNPRTGEGKALDLQTSKLAVNAEGWAFVKLALNADWLPCSRFFPMFTTSTTMATTSAPRP